MAIYFEKISNFWRSIRTTSGSWMWKLTTWKPRDLSLRIYQLDLRLRILGLLVKSIISVVSSSLVPRLYAQTRISEPFVLLTQIWGFFFRWKFRVFERNTVYLNHMLPWLSEFPNLSDFRKTGGFIEIFYMLFLVI